MNGRLLFVACWLFTSVAFAETAPSPNLLSNPGFEEGIAPWAENNWLHNEVRYERDKVNPHSGTYSYKMQFTKAINDTLTQFLYPNLAVKPNQTLRVSYWARGISNGPSLHLLIRKGEEPYTVYFRAESIPTEQWQEFVYTISLPAKIDQNSIQLAFQLRGLGTIWMDDVSVTEMPAVEEGEAPRENPIRNASFEAGRDGWTGTFRLREFGTAWEESGSNSPSPEGSRLMTTEAADAPQGRRYLSFDIPEQGRAVLTSAYFPARYGHAMTLKFSLRSSAPVSFHASVASGKNGNVRLDGGSTLRSSEKWQTFSVPVTLNPAPGGVYCAFFDFPNPGHYDLDAVSLIEKESPGVPLYPPAISIIPTAQTPIAHLYALNQDGKFQVQVAGMKSTGNYPCIVTVLDYLDQIVAQSQIDISLDAEGYGQAAFPVPTNRYGAFRMEVRHLAGQDTKEAPSWWQRWLGQKKTAVPKTPTGPLLAEQIYSVLPELPAPGERPDSYFGSHVDLNSYNLEIARRAGFRWLRLYPPLMTQWMAMEHTPGNWTFQTESVAKAKSLGFRILANLGTAPNFAADVDPKGEKARWTRSYPPADLNRWKEYIVRAFNAFSPTVDAWEIWNEPDGGYLKVRPGLDKTEIYFSLLKAAREALDSTGKPVFVTGPAIANINAPLGWGILDKGAAEYLDAFSFHFYSLAAGGNNPDIDFLNSVMARYASYHGKNNGPLPLWHTEGGIYLAGSQSWLQTYRIPPSSVVTPAQGAASIIRSAIYFKAYGVKRHFAYQSGTSETGRRTPEDITCGFIDVTGIPGPGIAAHAAMVSLVEDATGSGFETRVLDGVPVRIAHFTAEKNKIDVYWATTSVALSKILVSTFAGEVFDMMGNPISLKDANVGEYPIYVRSSLNR